MSNVNRIIYPLAITVAILFLLLAAAYFGAFGSIQQMTSDQITILLGVITAVTTIVFAFVATLNLVEAKKVRSEMVRPHLSLEPAYFEFDTKTGDITGFTCLNLVNGGTVARDVEIDFCSSGKCNALYASSVGTNDRVQLWNGRFSELGSNISVEIKYKNMFNKSLHEILAIDIDSIKKDRRKFVPVLNSAYSK